MLFCSIALAALFFTGCSYLRSPKSQPRANAKSQQLATNAAGGVVTMRTQQIQTMRFADNYAA